MITTLEHGVTVHEDAEGSIVKSVSVENKRGESTLPGMVGGRTETVRAWTHTEVNTFSVTGSGDLTLETGENKDARIGLISGGLTNILSFKYDQKLPDPSEWTYSGNNHPHAIAA